MQRKRPLHGKIFARCIPKRLFAGLFGCMARISCQSQLILDTRRRYAATNWRFSRPRPLSGCMERKTCHGLTPGNAPRRNLATARPPRTHRARILPLPVRPRAHQGAIPPPPDAGKRTSRAFCHRRAPRAPMCHGSRSAHALWLRTPPVVYATRHPDAAELRVLQAVRALAVTQPADCRVAAERVVNIAKLVSVPQRRSATTPCAATSQHRAPRHHAPYAALLSPLKK